MTSIKIQICRGKHQSNTFLYALYRLGDKDTQNQCILKNHREGVAYVKSGQSWHRCPCPCKRSPWAYRYLQLHLYRVHCCPQRLASRFDAGLKKGRAGEGIFWRITRQWFTAPRPHTSKAHNCKSQWHLIHRAKRLWVCLRFYFKKDYSCLKRNDVTAANVAERSVLHLAQQRAEGIVWASAKRGRTCSISIPVHVDARQDRNVLLAVTFLSWFSQVITNDGTVENSESVNRNGNILKTELRKEQNWRNWFE